MDEIRSMNAFLSSMQNFDWLIELHVGGFDIDNTVERKSCFWFLEETAREDISYGKYLHLRELADETVAFYNGTRCRKFGADIWCGHKNHDFVYNKFVVVVRSIKPCPCGAPDAPCVNKKHKTYKVSFIDGNEAESVEDQRGERRARISWEPDEYSVQDIQFLFISWYEWADTTGAAKGVTRNSRVDKSKLPVFDKILSSSNTISELTHRIFHSGEDFSERKP